MIKSSLWRESPLWLSRLRTQLVSMRTQVRSLASLRGLRIRRCYELWCSHRHGLDPVLLWLRHRLAAAAPIRPLAWEPPYTAVQPQKSKKKRKEQKEEERKKGRRRKKRRRRQQKQFTQNLCLREKIRKCLILSLSFRELRCECC